MISLLTMCQGTPPASSHTLPDSSVALRQTTQETDVGENRLSHSDLSDEELEAHIEHCTHLMELAYERWEQGGCFSDRGEANRWRILRDEAIRSRSPAQVARMESERGLA